MIRTDIPKRFNEYDALDKHWLRYSATLQGTVVPPYEVLIHPSSSCNLRCSWCIGEHVPSAEQWREAENVDLIARDNGGVREGMFLPNTLSDPTAMMNLVRGIVDYRKAVDVRVGDRVVHADFGVQTVSFSGLVGEPLASKKALLPAIAYLTEQGLGVGIFTNGTIMEDDVIAVLLKAEYVLISLDAATAETYAALKFGGRDHGRKLFAKVLDNVLKLSRMRVSAASALKINASFILYPENYHELLDAARLAKDMGIDCFRFKQDNSGSKRLSPHQAATAKQLIEQAKAELEDANFTVVSIHKSLTVEETLRDFSHCQITDLMAAVGSDGCLYPCNYHPRPGGVNYGDAAKTSWAFQAAWEGSTRKALKENLPNICPPTCDPFKNRANKMMSPLREAHITQGLGAARTVFETMSA